ncbi:MAG: hypothetical protein GWN01_09450 [Nitrosopumilaceae archaeon]|nr:hypothetical protein [Nitrosopumilaceae archaeon]NIU87834.1 hypothetical protein [Nitrosopumilaceae archaeon]NIV65216.1 hypothetical protein [Nitrosopumilaceae archaeon]NIX61732.1 hypothetical protein [Nitrosopumilaceae archaeon]
MKLGKTINDLAKEINLQNQNKEDLIASTSYMDVHSNGRLRLQIILILNF